MASAPMAMAPMREGAEGDGADRGRAGRAWRRVAVAPGGRGQR